MQHSGSPRRSSCDRPTARAGGAASLRPTGELAAAASVVAAGQDMPLAVAVTGDGNAPRGGRHGRAWADVCQAGVGMQGRVGRLRGAEMAGHDWESAWGCRDCRRVGTRCYCLVAPVCCLASLYGVPAAADRKSGQVTTTRCMEKPPHGLVPLRKRQTSAGVATFFYRRGRPLWLPRAGAQNQRRTPRRTDRNTPPATMLSPQLKTRSGHRLLFPPVPMAAAVRPHPGGCTGARQGGRRYCSAGTGRGRARRPCAWRHAGRGNTGGRGRGTRKGHEHCRGRNQRQSDRPRTARHTDARGPESSGGPTHPCTHPPAM